MQQIDAKMWESQLPKVVAKHGITTGLQIVPQASIPPIVPNIGIVPGEGTSQLREIEQHSPPPSQALAPTMAAHQEQVIIHDIEIDLDEGVEPIAMIAHRKKGEPMQRKQASKQDQQVPLIQQVDPPKDHKQYIDQVQ